MIIFRPICWITELYYYIRYDTIISGHSCIEQDDNSLQCERGNTDGMPDEKETDQEEIKIDDLWK